MKVGSCNPPFASHPIPPPVAVADDVGGPLTQAAAHEAFDVLAQKRYIIDAGFIMRDLLPNFNVDGYVPVLCSGLTLSSQPDYGGTGVVLTCDRWFCNGLDVFSGSQRTCTHGCHSGTGHSWSAKWRQQVTDAQGSMVWAHFAGHYVTERLLGPVRRARGTMPNALDEDDVWQAAAGPLAGRFGFLAGHVCMRVMSPVRSFMSFDLVCCL